MNYLPMVAFTTQPEPQNPLKLWSSAKPKTVRQCLLQHSCFSSLDTLTTAPVTLYSTTLDISRTEPNRNFLRFCMDTADHRAKSGSANHSQLHYQHVQSISGQVFTFSPKASPLTNHLLVTSKVRDSTGVKTGNRIIRGI